MGASTQDKRPVAAIVADIERIAGKPARLSSSSMQPAEVTSGDHAAAQSALAGLAVELARTVDVTEQSAHGFHLITSDDLARLVFMAAGLGAAAIMSKPGPAGEVVMPTEEISEGLQTLLLESVGLDLRVIDDRPPLEAITDEAASQMVAERVVVLLRPVQTIDSPIVGPMTVLDMRIEMVGSRTVDTEALRKAVHAAAVVHAKEGQA